MILKLLRAGKTNLLVVTAILIACIAVLDWRLGTHVSLGILYIVPMMIGALVLPLPGTAGLALLCSFLRSCFDVPGSPPELALRFLFAALAYCVSGLFVTELMANRRRAVQHLEILQKEQALRRDAEEQLRILAESSPAAILTIDSQGVVLAANRASGSLFGMPDNGSLAGREIRRYVPVLAEALHPNVASVAMRTTAQCQAYRDNGEVFLADMWFSSYSTPLGPRLGAIVVDSSEEMRDREELGLQQLLTGNAIGAVAMAHEVRNFCGAIRLASGNLCLHHALQDDADYRSVSNLIEGLDKLASIDAQSRMHATECVSLKSVMDNVRIVVEPDWREIDGSVRWLTPQSVPDVIGERHGLMQVFLNLMQNSHRAVQDAAVRELTLETLVEGGKVQIWFKDTGPGIPNPEKLFRPFQDGAVGTGLGLYISRSIVRSFGGDLKYVPQREGACFVVELQPCAAIGA